MDTMKKVNSKIKSPLNYIGGKTKILDQILPLFPNDINSFVDLFSGGCNVGINVKAKKIIFNDNLTPLIDMFKLLQLNEINDSIFHIENRIREFELSIINEEGYKKIREFYNDSKHPLDLLVLIAFSFNHQIRFNNKHYFNTPFGKARSCFNSTMKSNLEKFVLKMKASNVVFKNDCFNIFDFSNLTTNDLVYCDPPYLITTGSYNDGKRGFKGWTELEEHQLLNVLNNLHKHNIKFALSNVLEHKGKTNEVLKVWITENNYNVHFINKNYANANYQTINKDKNSSLEVLITNYDTPHVQEAQPYLVNINDDELCGI